jgi:hypothetical protein
MITITIMIAVAIPIAIAIAPVAAPRLGVAGHLGAGVGERALDRATDAAIAVALVEAIDVVEAAGQALVRGLVAGEVLLEPGVLDLELPERIDLIGVAVGGAGGDAGASDGGRGGEHEGGEARAHVGLTPAPTPYSGSCYDDRVRRAGKIGLGVAGALGAYLVALLIAGFAARGHVRERTRARLAESLDADVALADLELGLIRGVVGMDGLTIERDHDGHLYVGVDRIDAGIAPLGAYLWDHDLGDVTVSGVDVDVTGWGVLKLKPPRRPPIRFARLAIDDAQLTFAAATWAPAWTRFRVTIDHAQAGDTVLRTPMSWVFALERLDAHLEVPGAAPVDIHFAGGRLEASGSLFGPTPVSIPVTLPAPEPGHEGQQLRALGADLAERLALARASGWIEDELAP